ncbi:MAG: c-type cytochrome [Deltaproteobacteria bacterium]|nr:c-type cytochrome [Deltaproteobacteria bacterium]
MKQDEPRIWHVVFAGLVVGSLVWFWAGQSVAQEKEVAAAGKNVYDQNCAVCHGREAKGDGGAVSLLTVKPADLTQIAKRAGGTFPFWKVYGVIDGREEVKGHGTRDMPIWGAEFRAQAGSSPAAESQTRGRVLELVYYLQSIQAK